MFEKASQIKLRINTTKGYLAVENLWDLSLKDLNILAKSLNRKLKELEEEDFLEDINNENDLIKLQFNIVYHILKEKKKADDNRRIEAELKVQREKILGILAKKQDSTLENLSEKELIKKLKDLG